ncbi:ferredoxin-type protein NapG [Aliiruegeria sabulilitoris]|uniref:ferredoxin-type protein NapG n=1 Tax=Aliiruegeria sabulilitoris TaxID=1510458 RepID=UPI00082A70B0|nr:ferredoxin-type protein NapG [Aliiruegeria sabulilitoris]NDR58391.1 ferredoxin-type protein NapG [Pseudoruegeria sp. M32A2M]
MATAGQHKHIDRRRFMTDSARMAAGCAVAGSLLAYMTRDAKALPDQAIRPPGALGEDAFLAACIRCGLCVRDCPYDTLVLADLGQDGPATGTPYFTARDVPCEMCDDIPCVLACPTGALDKGLTNIEHAQMGTAVLVDQENCLNYLGLRCDVCYRVCPMIDEAITLDLIHNERSGHHAIFAPIVHADACTGCGICEKKCVLPEPAIKVLPVRLARGAPGEHYRLGWEEKDAKGAPVVEGIIDLPDRLPGPGTDNLAAPGGYIEGLVDGLPSTPEGGFEPVFKLPEVTK